MEQNLQKRLEGFSLKPNRMFNFNKMNYSFSSMDITFRIIILLAHTNLMFLKVEMHPPTVYGSEVL